MFEISFLGIKKITLKEKYVFNVLDVQLEILIVATFTAGYARSTGPSHMVHSIKHGGVEKKIYELSCLFVAICLIRVCASHVFLVMFVCIRPYTVTGPP